MIIQNTSKIPLRQVHCLLRFAAEHSPAELDRVCVNVKNAGRGTCGRAYGRVPAMSNAPPTARYLVVLRIYREETYPRTNMFERWRWGPTKTWDEYRAAIAHAPGDERNWRGVGRMVDGIETHGMQRRYLQRTPYGGQGSPLIEFADWQEHFVGLAVHEFQHIWQFQHRAPCSEIACERAAAYAVKQYRSMLQARKGLA
jgi:hypothetical protein